MREGTADRHGERLGLGRWNSQAYVILVAIGLGSDPVEERGAEDTRRDGCWAVIDTLETTLGDRRGSPQVGCC